MDLSPYYQALVLVHVVGVLVFLVAHSVSVYAVVRLPSMRDMNHIRRLLELSRRSLMFSFAGLLTFLIGGLLAGLAGGWWTSGQYWIWASVVVVFLVMGAMTPLGRFYLDRVRAAVGVDPQTGKWDAAAVSDAGALQLALGSGRPVLLLGVGVTALVVLFWLMIAKPF